MSMSNNRTTTSGIAFYVAAGKILAMIAQFIMPLFLTRFLTKHDYGLYSQFYLIFGFLLSVLGMGMQSNLYFFYPKSSSNEQKHQVWGTYILLMFMGIIGCLFFLIPPINHFIVNNAYLEEYVYLIAACVFLGMPSLMIDPLSVVRKDKLLAIIYHPVEIVSKIILVIAFALIFKSLDAIFYGILILEFLIFVFVTCYLTVNYHYPSGRSSCDLLKRQIAYSLPFGVAVILNTFAGRFDKLLSVSFLTPEEYATYSIAFFGIPGIMQVYDSLCQVNVTNMARLYKDNDILGVKAEYQRFVVKTLSFSLPVILIAFIYTPQIIILLFTEKYIDSVPFFRIYILTFILGMVGSGTILRAIDRTKLSMKAYLISVCLTLPLSYFLIKTYGIWGAIVSVVISTIVPKLFQIGFEMRSIQSSFKDYFPWRRILFLFSISLAGLLPVILLNAFVDVKVVLAIVISIIYVLSVYGVYIYHGDFIVDPCVLKSYAVALADKLRMKR